MKGRRSFQGFHPISALVLHLHRVQCDLRSNKAILLRLELGGDQCKPSWNYPHKKDTEYGSIIDLLEIGIAKLVLRE